MSQKSNTFAQNDRSASARRGAGQRDVTAPPRDLRGPAQVVGDYLRELTDRSGRAWNSFWFTPSDPLTLSVVRVLAGLVAFYSILTYSADLQLLLAPDGLLARDSVTQLRGDFYSISYFYWLDTPGRLLAAHVAGLVVLGMFTLGLFTRVTSILSLVVVLSYFHRTFVVTSEMEPILAFVMFYLCLGPAGAYLSIDRLLARRKAAAGGKEPAERPRACWSATVATRLIQVHLAVVYFMMVLAQLNETTWWDGTALWWIVGRRNSALLDLTWLYAHPWLVNAWTHGFVLFEGLFLVFAWNRLTAPLIVSLSVVMWGLMAVATGLAPLAAVMIAAGLSFLSPDSLRTLLGCCRLSALVE